MKGCNYDVVMGGCLVVARAELQLDGYAQKQDKEEQGKIGRRMRSRAVTFALATNASTALDEIGHCLLCVLVNA